MQTSVAPSPPTPAVPKLSTVSILLIALCGILMPTVTTLVEAVLHLCAQGYLDPMPTVGHVFAIATVPLANGFALWALCRRSSTHLNALIFAQAFAAAIAGAYALMFAQLTPVALFAITFWGLGLLPLTPLLSLIASLRALVALRKLRRALALPGRPLAWSGFAAGLVILTALTLVRTVSGRTQGAFDMARAALNVIAP